MRIVDVVFDTRVLTDTSHAYTMSSIAVDVGDEDVRGIGFGTETIIADIDPGIANGQTVHVVRIPAVGVFWEILYL